MSTRPKILINSNIPKLAELLETDFEIIQFEAGKLTNEKLIYTNADALVTRSTEKINHKLLDNTNIKYYATATSGTDHIDTNYLTSKGIKYFISSGCNSNSVAEYVLYNIFNFYEDKLNEKTIGIIGFGNIGNLLARYCNVIGMNVLVNDPPKKDNNYQFPNYVNYSTLNDLIKKSDILTNHIPMQTGKYSSINLLSNKNLKCFSGDLLIHASRGGIVDESALFDLNCHLVIDVWKKEPDINADLVKHANIATPHIAGHSLNGKLNATQMIYNDLCSFFNVKQREINLGLKRRTKFTKKNYYPLLNEIIKERRIIEDSEDFKSKLTENNISDNFINMRNNYPIRFESIK